MTTQASVRCGILVVMLAASGFAGCLGATLPARLNPAGEAPLAPLPNIDVPGAVAGPRDAHTAMFAWKDVAGAAWNYGAPVGVLGTGTSERTLSIPVPAGVRFRLDALLSWRGPSTADRGSDFDLSIVDEAGKPACLAGHRPFPEDALDRGGTKACRAVVEPHDALATWKVRVVSWRNLHDGLPFQVNLTYTSAPPRLGPALLPGQAAPGMAFKTALVDAERRGGEPSLKVDPEGHVFITALDYAVGQPDEQPFWRSTDRGEHFEHVDVAAKSQQPWSTIHAADVALGGGETNCGSIDGCGDADLALSPDGKDLYWTGMWLNCPAVAHSTDAGASWQTTPLTCATPTSYDRQWLAAGTAGKVWLAYNDPCSDSALDPLFQACLVDDNVAGKHIHGQLTVMRSTDHGQTWLGPANVIDAACTSGNMVVDRDGRVFIAECDGQGVTVAASEDGGATFAWRRVADRSGDAPTLVCFVCARLPSIATDDAGNLYVAWVDPSDGGSFRVWLSSSRDHAATWSAPVRVNHWEGTAVMPWIAARAPGRIAVAWYQTRETADPSNVTGDWYVHVAETADALVPAPAFREALASDQPAQHGPICLRGVQCLAGRNLREFPNVDLDAAGAAHVAFADGSGGDDGSGSRVRYARQVGGFLS